MNYDIDPQLFSLLTNAINEKDIQDFMNQPESMVIHYHFGLGRIIRNEFLQFGSPLYQAFVKKGITNTDEMSQLILFEFRTYLKSRGL